MVVTCICIKEPQPSASESEQCESHDFAADYPVAEEALDGSFRVCKCDDFFHVKQETPDQAGMFYWGLIHYGEPN